MDTIKKMELFGSASVRTLLDTRGVLSQLRSRTAVGVVQSRGGKTKYGGITRDPLLDLKKKLGQQNQRKQAKIPLVSEERRQMELSYPINATSLSKWLE